MTWTKSSQVELTFDSMILISQNHGLEIWWSMTTSGIFLNIFSHFVKLFQSLVVSLASSEMMISGLYFSTSSSGSIRLLFPRNLRLGGTSQSLIAFICFHDFCNISPRAARLPQASPSMRIWLMRSIFFEFFRSSENFWISWCITLSWILSLFKGKRLQDQLLNNKKYFYTIV